MHMFMFVIIIIYIIILCLLLLSLLYVYCYYVPDLRFKFSMNHVGIFCPFFVLVLFSINNNQINSDGMDN